MTPKPATDFILIVPRSRRLGLTFITLGLVFALSGFLFRHSFLGEHTTFILRVGGAVIILVGFFEFFRRGHRFAMTESGFDDQSYGGIGAVAWCEVSRFRVEKSLFAHGAEFLVFEPVDWPAFWRPRRSIWLVPVWLTSLMLKRSVVVHWLAIADSPEAAAAFMSQQLSRGKD